MPTVSVVSHNLGTMMQGGSLTAAGNLEVRSLPCGNRLE